MSTNTLFAKAARLRFRFATAKGQVSVEDLFTLSLTDLNNIAVALDEEIQKAGRRSFISTEAPSAKNTLLKDKLDVVLHIIESKIDEAERQKESAQKASQRAFLTELKAKKQLEKFDSLSLEEIEKQLKALE